MSTKKKWILFIVACLLVFANRYRIQATEKNTIYASFGDAIAAGAQAETKDKSFAELTTAALNKVDPNVTLMNFGIGDIKTSEYAGGIQGILAKIDQTKSGTLARATLLIGLNDLTTAYKGCDDCTLKATYAQAVANSYVYKKNLQTIISAILKLSQQTIWIHRKVTNCIKVFI